MIPKKEIKQNARKYGVPLSTIERDYAQNHFLDSSFFTDMAFKGGTGIKKGYIGDYRFSDDLDFTLLSEIGYPDLETAIQDSIISTRDKTGINFFDDMVIEENLNGFEITVYFQIMQRGTDRIKIKIDITKPENERIVLPLNLKEIIHPYSDGLSSKINIYALEEIMAEKIRSLFQRTRPRDLYDVWYLWDRVDTGKVMEVLGEKCIYKGVTIDLNEFETRKDDFKNAWVNSLKNQMKVFPDFEEVFSIVLERVLRLQRHRVND